MARHKSKPKRQDPIVEESHDETAHVAPAATEAAPLITETTTEAAPTPTVAATAAETASTITTDETPAASIPETNTSPAIPTTEPTATVTPPSFFRRFLSWIPVVNRWA